jgi:hypothetical protein
MLSSNPAAEGQSPQAREWVARRRAVDHAIAAAQTHRAEQQALAVKDLEQHVGDSPIFLLIGILLTIFLLASAFWWFLDTAQCDPLISSRGLSSACRSVDR